MHIKFDNSTPNYLIGYNDKKTFSIIYIDLFCKTSTYFLQLDFFSQPY